MTTGQLKPQACKLARLQTIPQLEVPHAHALLSSEQAEPVPIASKLNTSQIVETLVRYINYELSAARYDVVAPNRLLMALLLQLCYASSARDSTP